MNKMHPKASDWFGRADKWCDELLALRGILLASELTEDFKWNGPCYTLQGGNVVAIWSLKNCAALAFFKGSIMQDPAVILIAPGENSRSMRKIEFQNAAEIAAHEPMLNEYINQAAKIEKAGLKVNLDDAAEPEYPEELVAKLESDTDFRMAFETLTPGRQRGYLLHFSQAKQSTTRSARIEKLTPRILSGKGMHDR